MKKGNLFIIMLFFSFPAFAQFSGGKGDGIDKSTVIQTNLNGNIGGTRVIYQGGVGDGFNRNIVSAFLNGLNTNILYTGGPGDGFVRKQGSFYLDGTNLAGMYTGSSGDGFSRKQYGGFLNDVSAAVLYNGGSGDGFDKSLFSGIMDGTPISILYSGGAGDGFDKMQVQSYLNNQSLAALYSGGEGDGFATSIYFGTIKALPIKLLYFDAIAKETYVLVKWATEFEKNNDYFTIERSQNGVLFNNLVIVPGVGNSQTVQAYTQNDNDPLKGRSYYRLKWTDIDGRSEYSDIRSVFFKQDIKKDFLLFPNPNDGNIIHVQLDGITNNENISISVFDMQGKSIYQSLKPVFNGNQFAITLSQKLPKGSYVVRVIRNGETSSKVLIVQ